MSCCRDSRSLIACLARCTCSRMSMYKNRKYANDTTNMYMQKACEMKSGIIRNRWSHCCCCVQFISSEEKFCIGKSPKIQIWRYSYSGLQRFFSCVRPQILAIALCNFSVWFCAFPWPSVIWQLLFNQWYDANGNESSHCIAKTMLFICVTWGDRTVRRKSNLILPLIDEQKRLQKAFIACLLLGQNRHIAFDDGCGDDKQKIKQ